MGLIRYGITVSKVSGKVGEQVFAQNRYGDYIRSRCGPGRSRSIKTRPVKRGSGPGWPWLRRSGQR